MNTYGFTEKIDFHIRDGNNDAIYRIESFVILRTEITVNISDAHKMISISISNFRKYFSC